MLKITTEDNQTVGEVADGWSIADITPLPIMGSNAGGVGGINVDSVAKDRASRLPGETLFVNAGELGEATCYVTSVTQSPSGTVSLDLATEFKALDVEIEAPLAFTYSELQRVPVSSYATSVSADHDGYWLSLGARDRNTIPASSEPTNDGVIARYDNAGNLLYTFDGTNGNGGYVTSVAGATSGEWKAGSRMITVRHLPSYSFPSGLHIIEIFQFTTSATPPVHIATINNGTGVAPGQFSGRYIAVAMDELNRIYVGDGANRIQVFNPGGGFRSSFGSTGSGPTQFQGIQSIAVFGAPEGYTVRTIAVLEYTRGILDGPPDARVHQIRYDSAGDSWEHFTEYGKYTTLASDLRRSDRFFRPSSIAGAGAYLYVYDAGGPQPRVITLFGNESSNIPTAPGIIFRPRISVDERSLPQITTTFTWEDSPFSGLERRGSVVQVLDGKRPGQGSDYGLTKYNAPFLTNPRDLLEAYIRKTPYAGNIGFTPTVGTEIVRDQSLYAERPDFASISWKGNAWQGIKDFCAVNGILISAATGVINFQWLPEDEDTSTFLDIKNAQGFRKTMSKQSSFARITADNLNIKKYFGTSEPIYTAQQDENRIISFGVNTVLSLRLGDGDVYIPHPLVDAYFLDGNPIQYTVIDSQGIDCTAEFKRYGGTVNISVTEPGYFNLLVRGPVITLPGTVGPYSFARTGDAAAENAAVRANLSVFALGMVVRSEQINMGTGIIPDRASSDTTDVSTPFLTDAGRAYGAMAWVAARSGQEQQQINFTLPWRAGLELGRLAGRKIRYENATYMVSSASYSAGRVAIGAERYTQQSEVEALWEGSTAGQLDAKWTGRIALDATTMPLEK